MDIPSRVAEFRAGAAAPAVQLATRIAPQSREKLEQIARSEQITIRQFIENSIDRRWSELQDEAQSA
jgi:hypothetical protein